MSQTNDHVSKEKIYEEVGENYRFLAKWRQLAFAGHLAVLAGATSFAGSAIEHEKSRGLLWICFVFVSLLGLCFWIADIRTYRLTMHAIDAGEKLEGDSGGFFTENAAQDATNPPKIFSHTFAASVLFLGSSIVFAGGAIFAYFWLR